jgi:hypothetical protein
MHPFLSAYFELLCTLATVGTLAFDLLCICENIWSLYIDYEFLKAYSETLAWTPDLQIPTPLRVMETIHESHDFLTYHVKERTWQTLLYVALVEESRERRVLGIEFLLFLTEWQSLKGITNFDRDLGRGRVGGLRIAMIITICVELVLLSRVMLYIWIYGRESWGQFFSLLVRWGGHNER